MNTLTVSFNAETKFGDEVALYKGTIGSSLHSHYVEARNKITNAVVFQAVVE